jgi:hypothetical protein
MNLLIDTILRRKRLHPGDKCPESGQWTYSKESHGRRVQRTCSKGEIMPPPPEDLKGGYWTLTDATRH